MPLSDRLPASVSSRLTSILRAGDRASPAGVRSAIVVGNVDPEGLGRVRVALPDDGDRRLELWARTATMMAGADRGTWFLPDVGDEVIVAFDRGDPKRPIVIGSVWSATARPPDVPDAGSTHHSIVTRSGARITFDESDGSVITMRDAQGSSVTIGPAGVEVESSGNVTVRAAAIVRITAAQVRLDAAVVEASGTVKCDNLVTNTVVASSYTPGAGNLQ